MLIIHKNKNSLCYPNFKFFYFLSLFLKKLESLKTLLIHLSIVLLIINIRVFRKLYRLKNSNNLFR